jgi:hypothetical protein
VTRRARRSMCPTSPAAAARPCSAEPTRPATARARTGRCASDLRCRASPNAAAIRRRHDRRRGKPHSGIVRVEERDRSRGPLRIRLTLGLHGADLVDDRHRTNGSHAHGRRSRLRWVRRDGCRRVGSSTAATAQPVRCGFGRSCPSW